MVPGALEVQRQLLWHPLAACLCHAAQYAEADVIGAHPVQVEFWQETSAAVGRWKAANDVLKKDAVTDKVDWEGMLISASAAEGRR